MMQVHISDTIEAASVACTTGDIPGSSPAAAPPPRLSPLNWNTPSLWNAPAQEALKLDDPRWNTHPQVSFTPAHFVVLPEALKLPQAGRMEWQDPLGATGTRINATVLPLTAKDATPGAPRPAAEGSKGKTNWSRMLNTPAVLQMQAPLDAQSSAAGGAACALMQGKVTDLIVVDALARTPGADATDATDAAGMAGAVDASSPHSKRSAPRAPQLTRDGKGYPVGYFKGNPAVQSLVEPMEYAFPSESPFTDVRTMANAPTRPKVGLPRGSLHVDLKAADGSRQEHSVRTYALNLNAPNWPHQLMYALNAAWLGGKTKPLNLALMCQNGAGASGVVATALHGMECLEAFNGGEIGLDGVDDLARRLDDFIVAAGQRRSPSFAQLEGQSLDTRKMARSLWKAWSQVFSNPESAAVKKLRDWEAVATEAPETGAADIKELDALVISPPPEFADATDLQDAEPTGRRQRLAQARFTRQASNDSVDSGVTSDGSSVGSVSTLLRRSAAVRPGLSTTVEEFECGFDAETTSMEASPAVSPSHTVQTRPADAASSLPPAPVRPAVAQRGGSVPMAEDGGMPRRILHAASNIEVAKLKALLESPQTTRPVPGTPERSPRAADPQVTDRTAVSGAGPHVEARPATPSEQLKALMDTRLSATDGAQSALDAIPPTVRQRWAPGGPRFNAYRDRVNDLVKEMTARTGLIGYLRGRLSHPLDRALEPHTTWARDLVSMVQQDLREHALAQPSSSRAAPVNPLEDQAQVAQLARSTIKSLLTEHFGQLSTTEQNRWRHRVTGHSDRFDQALKHSLAGTSKLPDRLQPNQQPGQQAGATLPPLFVSSMPQRSAPGVGPTTLRPPVAQKSEETLRKAVDYEWAPRWVLELTREVATGKP